MRCDQCERELIADEPVWRIWSHRKRWRRVVCEACKPDKMSAAPEPCGHCSRPVHDHWPMFREGVPILVVCSPVCQTKLYAARSNAKRDRRRPPREPTKRTCDRCGESFTAMRSDASLCSSRCRQAHWRFMHSTVKYDQWGRKIRA